MFKIKDIWTRKKVVGIIKDQITIFDLMLTLPDQRINILLVGIISNQSKTYNWVFFIAERKSEDCWIIFERKQAINQTGIQILRNQE